MTDDKNSKKTCFMGINISLVNLEQLLSFIVRQAKEKTPTVVSHVNVHAMNVTRNNKSFAKAINNSDIVFCDGFGVKVGAAIHGLRIGQRMTPPDWIDVLFQQCTANSLTVYFLGDKPPILEKFIQTAKRKHPSLTIAGCHHGFFDMDGTENNHIIDDIIKSDADIVFTAMGMPRQELWALQSKEQLNKGVIISTGALFRWYSGVNKRKRNWLTDHGFEWLVQLAERPKERFQRDVIGIPFFFCRVVLWPFIKRIDNH